jgi:hypothetical protein
MPPPGAGNAAMTGSSQTLSDPAVSAEDRVLDQKVKGICKGC